MKRYFIKRFRNTKPEDIEREVSLQTIASKYGLSPFIVSTDYSTYIRMDNLNVMNIADMYGEYLDDIPEDIQNQIIDILWVLYHECKIEYLDITPYNFIEKEGKVFVIDFGDARKRGKYMDPFLEDIFDTWELKWNNEFR